MRAFEIIDASRTIVIDELHEPFRALAVTSPPPVRPARFRLIVRQIKPVDQSRRDRRTLQQMEIHGLIHGRAQGADAVGSRVVVDDLLQTAGPLSGEVVNRKGYPSVFTRDGTGLRPCFITGSEEDERQHDNGKSRPTASDQPVVELHDSDFGTSITT